MKNILKKSIRKISEFCQRYCAPSKEEIIDSLVAGTSALELKQGEFVELAPLPGCNGPFVLSGNSLPVFEYTVFEKRIMEFVRVKVELSRPSRIQFTSTIQSTTAPERHGESIPMRHPYRQPFDRLSLHLFSYFPHYVSPSKRHADPQTIGTKRD
jgi:hypothetical protein